MKKNKEYFPLFLSLEGKRIFIAGAGKIAARRAGVLLSFGAKLFVTAPECSGEMIKLMQGENGRDLIYRRKKFEECDLEGMDLVFAATDDTALNHRITELCRAGNIPVNNASCKEDCDFFFPAILREEGLTIGVSSGGEDHGKVAEVCGKLRRFFQISFQDKEG